MRIASLLKTHYGLHNELFVLCGIAGSGKTTLSEKISVKYNATLYTLDKLRTAKGEKHDRQIMYYNIVKDLANGNNVVCDDLNIFLKQRQKLLFAIKDIPCKKILIVMTTPLEKCICRNSQRQGQARLPNSVIYHLNSKFESPSYDEGWDEIYYCYEKE